MDLTTSKAVPLADLLAYMKPIVTRAGYTGDDFGTCQDMGGLAEGFSLGTTDGYMINIYNDDNGEFGEEGWVVEEFEIENLDPNVVPCVNLEAAVATFQHYMRKHPKESQEALGEEYGRWCDANNLPQQCATELADLDTLSTEQRAYLVAFGKRWDAASV